MPHRLCSSLSALGSNLRMFFGVLHEATWIVGLSHVIGLRGEYGNVLRSVVGLDVVQVMNPLTWQKVTSQLCFSHKAVLVDVSVSIRGGMVWRVNVDVSALVGIAPALPSVAVWPFVALASVPTAILGVLSLVNATISMIRLCDGRNLTAAAHTQPRGIRNLLGLPTSLIHLFGRFGPGPVALNVAVPFGNLGTTTA